MHLEGAVRPEALLEIARRNRVTLPADNASDLARLYEFRDFDHFIELWMMTTHAIRTEADFRQVVVAYAEEAAGHGAVYLEGIFTPAERISGGASWDEVFTGFCDGAAAARDRFGVEIRLTPDIPRTFPLEAAMETCAFTRSSIGSAAWSQSGSAVRKWVIRLSRSRPCSAFAWEGGVGSVPHAGETEGPESIRGALDALGADRIRHGIRGSGSGAPRRARGAWIVCDVCPVSNVRTRAAGSLDADPLPAMLAAGVRCSISTDDPAMFDTDLTREYALAERLGVSAHAVFESGLAGALCDDATKARLVAIANEFDWPT